MTVLDFACKYGGSATECDDIRTWIEGEIRKGETRTWQAAEHVVAAYAAHNPTARLILDDLKACRKSKERRQSANGEGLTADTSVIGIRPR